MVRERGRTLFSQGHNRERIWTTEGIVEGILNSVGFADYLLGPTRHAQRRQWLDIR
jgi:hypothetical protein